MHMKHREQESMWVLWRWTPQHSLQEILPEDEDSLTTTKKKVKKKRKADESISQKTLKKHISATNMTL